MAKRTTEMVSDIRKSLLFRISDYTTQLARAQVEGRWTSLPYLKATQDALKNWDMRLIAGSVTITNRDALKKFLDMVRSEISMHEEDRNIFLSQENYERVVQSDARACACNLMDKIMTDYMA